MEKNNFFANPDKSGQVVRKIATLGIVCMLFFAVVSCENELENDSQTFFMYVYVGGGHVRNYFEISSNQVVVKVGEGVTENDIKSFFQENASLRVSDISYMSERRDCEFKLIRFEDSNRNAIIQLADRLKPNNTILFIGYVIIDRFGRRSEAITNQIMVRLKNDDDFPILQKAIAPFNISKVRQFSEVRQVVCNSRRYLLTVNCVSGKSTLQIAKELHRTGLFEWTMPYLFSFPGFFPIFGM